MQNLDSEQAADEGNSARKRNEGGKLNSHRGGNKQIQFVNDIENVQYNRDNDDEKIDYTKADVELVGNKAIDIQDKSKKAVERIQFKLG